MGHHKLWDLRAAVYVTSAMLLFTSFGDARRAESADSPVIRIGTVAIDGGAEVLFAREMGFFKKAGLNVEVNVMASGAVITPAVVSGTLDIGFSNILSLAIAHKHHLPIKVIMPAGLFVASAPVALCMVPMNSTVKTGKDLNGKTFATSAIKGIGEYAPRLWIDKTGGDSSTTKFVEVGAAAQADALVQNRIDAAIIVEPYIAAAKRVARVLSNCYASIANSFVISAYFTSEAWGQAHPAQAKAFQEVMRETAIWARKHHTESANILVKFGGIDPSTLVNVTRADFGDTLDLAALQPTVDLAARYGAIDETFPAADFMYHPPAP